MAKASGFGFSGETSDLILLGIIGIGAYFVYTTVIKPTSNITNGVGNIANAGSGLISTGLNDITGFESMLARDVGVINNAVFGLGSGQANANANIVPDIPQVANLSTSNYVTSVTPSTAFNQNIVRVSTSTGQITTVPQTPSTYYPSLGIGFDSKNNGYSSFTALNR